MKLHQDLLQVLKKDDRLVVDGKLAKNKVIELALQLDADLLKLLRSSKDLSKTFFQQVDDVLVFDKIKFQSFVSNKQFLPDSFTEYKNKIGLSSDKNYLTDSEEVVLAFPYKDCVLEGGQSKEDAKRSEVFWNETLAPDEIDKLLEPKVLTNFKKYDSKGEHIPKDISNDDNLIIKGNNLIALHSLRKTHRGKINLIYIDPPFNTGSDSFNYNDKFNHSTWLTFMRNRLEVAKDLLSEDGNIFVHLDNNEFHYLKILMDEIFGRENFVEDIVWSYGSASGGRASGAKPVNIHDYICHFAKNYNKRKQNKLFTPYTDKYIDDWFKYEENGRKYQRRMRGRDESGEIIWEKQFLDESKGIPLTTVWSDIKQVYADPRAYKESQKSQTELVKGFMGQKPEKLMERIIEMSTDKGDLVMDYHLGSGTTCVVAHKMQRKYIGIEQLNYGEIDSVNRIQETINGDTAGISKTQEWKGGGSFVYAELAQANQLFVDKIQDSKNTKELLKVWDEMKKTAFLSYKVKPEEIDATKKDFESLSFEDQQKFLISTLDKNLLYVPYSEIEDKTYKVSKEDIALNNKFYGRD